jgi:competence protein ComEA
MDHRRAAEMTGGAERGGDAATALPRPMPRLGLRESAAQWVVWVGPARLAATACAVVAVCIGGWWLVRVPPPPTEAQLPYASAPSVTATALPAVSTTPAADMLVHVAGAVVHPGVYSVPSGARVVDAIAAGGGVTAEANTNALNLAAPVNDGERVYVPLVGEAIVPVLAAAPGASGSATAGPLNLNTATTDELDELPGVGPATAEAIVAHRQQHGPFASIDSLGDVRGIGPAKLEALRGLVTV